MLIQLLLGMLCACSVFEAIAQERPKLVAQTGHTNSVTSVAFSPDGKTALSGSADNTLRLWDIASGRELRSFSGHTSGVSSVAISPNGQTALSGSWDDSLRLWDLSSGRELRSLSGHKSGVTTVAISSDGKTAISGSLDHTVRLWDLAGGHELKAFGGHTDEVSSVVFSPDGKTALSGGRDKKVHLWELASGSESRSFSGNTEWVTVVAISPDGKKAILGGLDNTLGLWDLASGRELKALSGHSRYVRSAAFSPDGKKALSGSADGTLRLWDLASGRQLMSLSGHTNGVNSVAFSPDGKMALSGGADGTLRLWNLTSGRGAKSLAGHTKGVTSVAFSPDGKAALSGGLDRTLRLWDFAGGGESKSLGGHTDMVTTVAFSPDGKAALSGSQDETLRVWDLASGRELRSLSGHTKSVTSVAISPDGKTALSGSQDETLRLWDLASGRELRAFRRPASRVTSVAFSPDGKSALAGSVGTSHLWELASGRELMSLTEHTFSVSARFFTPNGKLTLGGLGREEPVAIGPDGKAALSGDAGGTLRLWDLISGRVLKALKGHTDGVTSVAFSPDGRTALSGSMDGTLRLWDLASGSELKALSGHTDGVTSVAFSPDGNMALSGSEDATIRLWRISDGKELATLISFTDGTWVVTDPEGRFDTADLESMPHLHWVMPDDPFTPVPFEAFMKDYYEPRLLARILAGETFKPVRALTTLNRTQPEVKVVSIAPDGSDPSLVGVTVSAAGATKSYLQGEGDSSRKVPRPTDVHDLRLFRDGQVVGYADGKLAEFSTPGSAFSKTFTVRLPRAKAGQDVVFSAYAFNDDRVKSESVRATYKAPALPASVAAASDSSKGRAYVISMGVNHHENSAWNLGYAANDARAVSQRVSADLRKGGQFADVVPLVLSADGSTQQASKAALRAVLARLAGQAPALGDEAALQGVAGADQLRKALPDDLVLLSFAGHGFADDAGQFYLVPQDTGAGSGKQITAALKAHSISSEELSLWLRDVDAGDMTMIVDACQSAASVQAEGFKPGPMGSRGLGQLSFDKGMRILAASQSDQYALEDARLQHGLLTFSLINDGLEAFNADFEPRDRRVWLDEWLKYGVNRVPTLADQVKAGKVVVANRGTDRGAVRIDSPAGSVSAAAAAAKPAQQPALFDFAKGRKPVVLAEP